MVRVRLRRTPRHCYGFNPELERLELGPRAAYCYDEDFSIAYRFAAALGYARNSNEAGQLSIALQRSWSRFYKQDYER